MILSFSSKAVCFFNCDGYFRCNSIFSFNGSSAAICQWIDQHSIRIVPSNNNKDNILPGDTITLLPGKIKRVCESVDSGDCFNYEFNALSTAIVEFPNTAIIPVPSLSFSSKISPCDDLVLDPTGSYGRGNRNWLDVSWTVLKFDTIENDIQRFLNANYLSTSDIIVIPKDLLEEDATYSISLALTNFLKQKAIFTAKITVGDDSTPNFNILGSKVIKRFRWQSINLRSNVNFPSCFRPSSFSYKWKVYQGFTFLSNVSSISSDPRAFELPPYSLDSGNIYTVLVTLFYKNSFNKLISTETSTQIEIGESGVIAKIFGGSEKTLSYISPIELDASSSYEMDYPTSNNLIFNWGCKTALPVYGSSCKINEDLFYLSKINLKPGSLAAGSSYEFTVSVSRNGSSLSSQASITITISSSMIPISTIESSSLIYGSSDKVVLSGKVSGIKPVQVKLTCDTIEDQKLLEMSLNPTVMISTLNVSSLQFSIKPLSLSPGIGHFISF